MTFTFEPWLVGLFITYGVASLGGLVRLTYSGAVLLGRVSELENRLTLQDGLVQANERAMRVISERLVRIETILERIEKKQ